MELRANATMMWNAMKMIVGNKAYEIRQSLKWTWNEGKKKRSDSP